MEIFGFSGKLGSGKNYVAERMFQAMLPERKTILLAFANHFKIDAIVKAGLDRQKVFGKKDDHTRRVLQIMGTEEGRNKYGEDIWINLAEEWRAYYEGLGYERAIIFDVRFPNEVEYIKRVGGKVVRIEAPERHLETARKEAALNGVELEKIINHASETSLDGYDGYDLVIKNDPQDNAVVQVRNFLRQYAKDTLPEYMFFVDVDDTIGDCHLYYEDTIDKVEKLLDGFTAEQKLPQGHAHAVFRQYVSQMRGRVDTTVFIHNRFATDLGWAIERTTKTFCGEQYDASKYSLPAYGLGMQVYDYPYHALPGAVEAVRQLQTLGKVVLFTLGDRLEQAKKIAGLGLSDIPFEVTHDKCVTTFQGLVRKYPATHHYMIGDNMKRDITPALEAGVQTAFWINPVYRKSAETDDIKPYHTVETLAEAVHHIESTINFSKAIGDFATRVAKATMSGPDLSPIQTKGNPTVVMYYPTIPKTQS